MADKGNNTQKSSKAYWSLKNGFLNNKKLPLTQSIFYDNKFVTDFKKN